MIVGNRDFKGGGDRPLLTPHRNLSRRSPSQRELQAMKKKVGYFDVGNLAVAASSSAHP